MAEVTAALVKELREKTDAPMMECKRALAEAGADLLKAEEILRVKLGTKASKAAARIAAEGVVALSVATDGKRAALVEVNCETDFVAKNDDFLAFAAGLADLVLQGQPADVAALAALTLDGVSVEQRRTMLVGKMGENLSIRRLTYIQAQGRIAHYVHGGARIGVLVDLSGGDAALGRDIAMHIAASRPRVLQAAAVPAADIARERSIAAQKAAESGKPAPVVAKMVEGAVQKFLNDITLLGQPFVKDDKLTIEQLLKRHGATVHAFALFVVGEGIERKASDFAAEVAAQAAAARGE